MSITVRKIKKIYYYYFTGNQLGNRKSSDFTEFSSKHRVEKWIMISRKIWEAEKFLNFHTVQNSPWIPNLSSKEKNQGMHIILLGWMWFLQFPFKIFFFRTKVPENNKKGPSSFIFWRRTTLTTATLDNLDTRKART